MSHRVRRESRSTSCLVERLTSSLVYTCYCSQATHEKPLSPLLLAEQDLLECALRPSQEFPIEPEASKTIAPDELARALGGTYTSFRNAIVVDQAGEVPLRSLRVRAVSGSRCFRGVGFALPARRRDSAECLPGCCPASPRYLMDPPVPTAPRVEFD